MFTLDQIIPWGRSFDEYRRFFALSDEDLRLRIVGCGDGPASFNVQATQLGANVTSFDPIYRFDASQIRDRIAATCDTVLDQARLNADQFVWEAIGSVDELGRIRMAAMNEFLSDYPRGKAAGRYIEAGLPSLPFADAAFDLALCSHLLFLYTTHLGEAFHLQAIAEMSRIASEARIFPLLALDGEPSPLVAAVASEFGRRGFDVSIHEVAYEFQRGGNKMMRIRRRERDAPERTSCGF